MPTTPLPSGMPQPPSSNEALAAADESQRAPLRFVRRADGLTYEFIRCGEAYGYPSYRRVDSPLWCRRLPDYGWSVCTESEDVLARPFADPGRAPFPPTGMWVSAKAAKAYVYDLIHSHPAKDPPRRQWHTAQPTVDQ